MSNINYLMIIANFKLIFNNWRIDYPCNHAIYKCKRLMICVKNCICKSHIFNYIIGTDTFYIYSLGYNYLKVA